MRGIFESKDVSALRWSSGHGNVSGSDGTKHTFLASTENGHFHDTALCRAGRTGRTVGLIPIRGRCFFLLAMERDSSLQKCDLYNSFNCYTRRVMQ
jgi:hypothetical protein